MKTNIVVLLHSGDLLWPVATVYTVWSLMLTAKRRVGGNPGDWLEWRAVLVDRVLPADSVQEPGR